MIGEEFGQWEDARRRIDLLAIDHDGQLVVIELKRTDDGGHMELQALRYAAMVSAMTFDQVAEAYSRHKAHVGGSDVTFDARRHVSDWLHAQDGDEPAILSTVRIVLISQDFGREITTLALWLNDQYDFDIRCVRMTPYEIDGRVLLDVRQVIPLPEAQEYQVSLRRKEQVQERALRDGRDFTRYQVVIDNQPQPSNNKRRSILAMVRALVDKNVPIEQVAEVLGDRHMVAIPNVDLDLNDVAAALSSIGKAPDRYFTNDVFPGVAGTYVLSLMWGTGTSEMLSKLSTAFPDSGIGFQEAEE